MAPRRARIEGSQTFVSLNSRLFSNKEEDWGRTDDEESDAEVMSPDVGPPFGSIEPKIAQCPKST